MTRQRPASAGSQAAALNTALNAADAPGTLTLTSVAASTGHDRRQQHRWHRAAPLPEGQSRAPRGPAGRAARTGRAARVAVARCRGIRRRLFRVFLLRGIDGQYTFRTAQGTIRTLAFERGVVQSVSGSDIVVRAVDGTTWSWNLVSNTVVREDGAKTSTSALASGEPVWVGGPVMSGAKDARLVVIRPPSAPSASHRPSPRQRRQHPAADRRCYRLPQAPAAAGAGSLCWPSAERRPQPTVPPGDDRQRPHSAGARRGRRAEHP